MKIGEIAFTEFLGLPIVVWGGLVTLLMFILTAAISFLNMRGIHKIPQKYHKPMAVLSIAMGLVHGFMGMAASMGL